MLSPDNTLVPVFISSYIASLVDC